MKNEIQFDYASNPELAEIFSRKSIGDKCKMTIEFEVVEKDSNGAKGMINEITVPENYGGKKEKEPLEMDAKQPVAIVVMSKAEREDAAA